MVPDASKRPGPLVFGVDFGVRVSGDMQRARASDDAAHREHGALLGAGPVAAVLLVLGVEVQRLGDIAVERHELLAGPGTPAALWLRREQTTQLGLGFGVVAQFEKGQ